MPLPNRRSVVERPLTGMGHMARSAERGVPDIEEAQTALIPRSLFITSIFLLSSSLAVACFASWLCFRSCVPDLVPPPLWLLHREIDSDTTW